MSGFIPTRYAVAGDCDYGETHKRERLTVWSGTWCDVFEAEGLSLPGRDGYMLTTYNGDRVRVACPMRTDDTYEEVDAAISEALNRHHEARGDVRLI